MNGKCSNCGEYPLHCTCDIGRVRRGVFHALRRLTDYVQNCDNGDLENFIEGKIFGCSELIHDWSLESSATVPLEKNRYLNLTLRGRINHGF